MKKYQTVPSDQNRLFYPDVIRAVSAVLIVVYHFSYSVFLFGKWSQVDILHATANGSWGMTPVYCFFMVSGASLMHRYGRAEKLELGAFYKKRFFSIYPLFWIAYTIGFFAVYWQLGHLYDIPSRNLFWSVIGMDGWVVNWIPTFYMVGEWFLGSIIMLYLAFPLVRFFWKKNHNLTMAVSALAAGVLFWYHPFPMDIKQNPVIDLFYFLFGAWIEEMRRRHFNGSGKKGWGAGGVLWLASPLVMAVWWLVPMTESLPAMELTVSAQAYGLGMFLRQSIILVCTFWFYVFWMGISWWMERNMVKKGIISIRAKKIIMEISKKSYGIFLTHHMVSQLICGHFDRTQLTKREVLAILVLVLLATWIMTLAIYRIQSYIKERF